MHPFSAATPRAAFAELYRSHLEAVVNYVARRADRSDAVDVAAETFTVAWRRLDEIPVGAERPWLYGVARRTLANHRRGDSRRSALHDRLVADWGTVAIEATSPEAQTASLEPLRQALARLSSDDQDILLLSGVEELKPSEIATVLEVTPEVARNRLSRARTRLRTELAEVTQGDLS